MTDNVEPCALTHAYGRVHALIDNDGRDISNSVHSLIAKGNKSNKLETFTQLIFNVNKELVIEENKTPHNWKNPVWHHEDGSVAEW